MSDLTIKCLFWLAMILLVVNIVNQLLKLC